MAFENFFFNLAEDPVTSAAVRFTPGEAVEFQLKIQGRAGYVLTADEAAGWTIEAKPGGAGSWTDITATAIALGAYIGQKKLFDFRVTAPAGITERVQAALPFHVAPG